MKIIIGIIVFFIIRDFLAWLFHWGEGETFVDLFENAAHNRAIDEEWEKNGRPIVEKTIGWRPDPWNKNDGMKNNGDGSYSRLISGGTDKYRARFARDVEESKKR